MFLVVIVLLQCAAAFFWDFEKTSTKIFREAEKKKMFNYYGEAEKDLYFDTAVAGTTLWDKNRKIKFEDRVACYQGTCGETSIFVTYDGLPICQVASTKFLSSGYECLNVAGWANEAQRGELSSAAKDNKGLQYAAAVSSSFAVAANVSKLWNRYAKFNKLWCVCGKEMTDVRMVGFGNLAIFQDFKYEVHDDHGNKACSGSTNNASHLFPSLPCDAEFLSYDVISRRGDDQARVTCRSPQENGWPKGSYIELDGLRFCEDFTTGKEKIENFDEGKLCVPVTLVKGHQTDPARMEWKLEMAGGKVFEGEWQDDFAMAGVSPQKEICAIRAEWEAIRIECTNKGYNQGDVKVLTVTKNWGIENSWKITDGSGKTLCQASGFGSHTETETRCDLHTDGPAFLQCNDSYGDGWHGGYVEIDGWTYCSRFTHGSSSEKLWISGGQTKVLTVTKNWGSENSWKITNNKGETICSASGFGSNMFHTQECNLPFGQVYVHCNDSYGDGWHGGYLAIHGVSFCDEFSSGKKFTEHISGPEWGWSGGYVQIGEYQACDYFKEDVMKDEEYWHQDANYRDVKKWTRYMDSSEATCTNRYQNDKTANWYMSHSGCWSAATMFEGYSSVGHSL